MCFLLLNFFLFSSCCLGFYGELPLCFFFLRVASCRLRSALISALDSAKYVHCEGPAALSSPSSIAKKLRPSSTSSCNARFSDAQFLSVSTKMTFLSVTASTYIHIYAHPENRSLIQSFTLMRLATRMLCSSKSLIYKHTGTKSVQITEIDT